MWLGPLLFMGASLFFWLYIRAAFMPRLMTRSAVAFVPLLADVEMVVFINALLIYFGVYIVAGLFWRRLKRRFRNPFLLGLALWLINVFVLFPILGRGVLGYRLPQGWMAASLPLFVTHWLFARGLQYQESKERR